jgi:hypothetical protein
MTRIAIALTLLAAAGTAWAGGQPPQKLPENVEKDRKVVTEYLEKIKGTNGQTLWIDHKDLAAAFPKHTFFAVRYRIYPVAMQLPEGLAPSNVFVVEGGTARHVKDAKALEEFFKAHLGSVKDVKLREQAVAAWLMLSQEFVQDGFFKFKVNPAEAADGGTSFTGRAMVQEGGKGEIKAELKYDKDGKLLAATETVKVMPGPRPICQATKLLDADPIVRRMAEQELLFLGLAARQYLMEQRAIAGPELRQAIDALWQRIEQAGW